VRWWFIPAGSGGVGCLVFETGSSEIMGREGAGKGSRYAVFECVGGLSVREAEEWLV